MSDLLATSEQTWREPGPVEPRVPADLVVDTSVWLPLRLRGWKKRRDHRERRAQEFYGRDIGVEPRFQAGVTSSLAVANFAL